MNYSLFITQFHFLRPDWLWLILFIPLLVLLKKGKGKAAHSDWAKTIPPQLLKHLIPPSSSTSQSWNRLYLTHTVIFLTALSLAGPTWMKLPQPVQKKQDNLVVMLDLSLSMLAKDEKPDRIIRAKQKLEDLLKRHKEGNVALIAYAGDSHVVTPLTDDTHTIITMLPALGPMMMPVMGSTTKDAVKQALQLLKQSPVGPGRLLLITDGVSKTESRAVTQLLKNTHYPLNILAVGTPEGAPIPVPGQGYLKEAGRLVVAKVNMNRLRQLAEKNGGQEHIITLSNADLNDLIFNNQYDLGWDGQNTSGKSKKTYDLWFNEGFWIILLLIPLVLLGYRKGILLPVIALLIIAKPQPSYALDWSSLWKNADQQGYELLQKHPKQAVDKFESPRWKAAALYQSKQYQASASIFSSLKENDANHYYNLGNALAKDKKYKAALHAYNKALKINPSHKDALFNKKIVEKILNQKKKQNKQNKNKNKNKNQKQNKQKNKQQSKQKSKQKNKQQSKQQSKQKNRQQNKQQQAQQHQNLKKTRKSPNKKEKIDSSPLSKEEKQSYKQWMRRIPDNPGGLLRRKFKYQSQHNQNQQPYVKGAPIW